MLTKKNPTKKQGLHECLMYTEFPKFMENSLSCTVEPIFNTSNSKNHCYNVRAKKHRFFLYLIYFCKIDTASQPVKTGKKAPKLLIETNP